MPDKEYHADRARAERELAYRSPDERAGDAHLRLAALHLTRAMMSEEVEQGQADAAPAPQFRILS